MEKKHVIKSVNKGSIADSLGILPGDIVIKIDDNEIEDIFDYQFMTLTDELVLTILRGMRNGNMRLKRVKTKT